MDPWEPNLHPWIKQTLIKRGDASWTWHHGIHVDQWCGRLGGVSSNAMWHRPTPPSRPTAICHVHLPPMHLICPFLWFSCIHIIFPSTSRTRWIINKIWHMWCCFTLVLGGMLMEVLVIINNLPQATPLLVPSKDAGLACWIRNCFNITPCKNSYTNQYSLLSWAS